MKFPSRRSSSWLQSRFCAAGYEPGSSSRTAGDLAVNVFVPNSYKECLWCVPSRRNRPSYHQECKLTLLLGSGSRGRLTEYKLSRSYVSTLGSSEGEPAHKWVINESIRQSTGPWSDLLESCISRHTGISCGPSQNDRLYAFSVALEDGRADRPPLLS